MLVIFLKTSLSLCSNSYAQNIPTRISNYKSSVNTNITSKTATSSITRTDVGNSYNNLADLVKVLYDTMKATGTGNLQNVTDAGATTTNALTVGSSPNFSYVAPAVITANSQSTSESIQLYALNAGTVHPALKFIAATKTGQLGARVTTNPNWMLPDSAGTLALKSNVGVYSVSGTSPIVAGSLSGGTQAISLATSGVTAGTYGSSTAIPVISFDAFGRATSVSTVAPSGGGGGSTPDLQAVTTAGATCGNTITFPWVAPSNIQIFPQGIQINASTANNIMRLTDVYTEATIMIWGNSATPGLFRCTNSSSGPVWNLPNRGGDLAIVDDWTDKQLTAGDADYIVPTTQTMVILPTITALRSLTLPSLAGNLGKTIKIWNQNTSGTNSWKFAGTGVKDAAGNAVTNLANQRWYILEATTTVWAVQN